MNRKFRRKRLTLITGINQQIPINNLNNLNQINKTKFKCLKLKENNRQKLLSFNKWIIILLMLGCLINLFKYANSQTATDLLVASSSSRNTHLSADVNVNNFFHNSDSNNNPFINNFPNLSNQNDQLVNTVQNLVKNNQKQTASNQRDQLINNNKLTTTPITLNNNNNKNRSTRTNRNNQRLNESNNKNNKINNLTIVDNVSTNLKQTTNKPTTTTTFKQQNTNKQNVNKSENKVDSRTVVAGNTKPRIPNNLNNNKNIEQPEIIDENLKVESSLDGTSTVEYITENEEKLSLNQNQSTVAGISKMNLNENEMTNELNNDNNNNENKDIYSDLQGEYLFNHPTYPHKMQYESEIQRLDGKYNLY